MWQARECYSHVGGNLYNPLLSGLRNHPLQRQNTIREVYKRNVEWTIVNFHGQNARHLIVKLLTVRQSRGSSALSLTPLNRGLMHVRQLSKIGNSQLRNSSRCRRRGNRPVVQSELHSPRPRCLRSISTAARPSSRVPASGARFRYRPPFVAMWNAPTVRPASTFMRRSRISEAAIA